MIKKASAATLILTISKINVESLLFGNGESKGQWSAPVHAVVIVSYLLRCAAQSTHKMVKPTLQNQHPIIVKCFNIGKSIYRFISTQDTFWWQRYSSMAKSVTWSQSNRACFLVSEDRKPTNKQQLASVKTWRSISRDPWAPDYRQALTAKDFPPSIKTVLIFTVMSLCPNTIEPLKMEVLCLKWL